MPGMILMVAIHGGAGTTLLYYCRLCAPYSAFECNPVPLSLAQEHLARMKEKIEAARRARELASPRPHTKKRTSSFAGGRSTPRTATSSGGAGTGGAGGSVWGQQGGGGQRATGSRKGGARSKARSVSDCGRCVGV